MADFRHTLSATVASLVAAGSLAATTTPAGAGTQSPPAAAGVGRAGQVPHRQPSLRSVRVSVAVNDQPAAGEAPCQTDGGRVVLRGRLVATRQALRRRQLPMVVTVNDFGLSSGAAWHPGPGDGYDMAAATARRGVAWLLLDLAGYGSSTRPPGAATCLSAQAAMVDQAVGLLRHGSYRSSGPKPRAGRVVLWGQAVGGAVAEMAARDVPTSGLVISSWSDSGPTAAAVTAAMQQAADCQQDPNGYAYFGRTRAQFEHLYFAAAPRHVQDRAFAVREKDPCGDLESLPATMAANNAGNPGYTRPVLLVYGGRDAVTTTQGRRAQASSFSKATVTTVLLPKAGDAVTLEPGHRQLAERFVRWWRSLLRSG